MKERILPVFEKVKIDRLVKSPFNYKDNDEEMSRKLVANIRKNGQLETILVRRLPTGSFEICNGNHRYDAMCELGMDEVMVCNIGTISDTQAKRIAIELNETGFPNDILRLSANLIEVSKEFGEECMDTLPYDEKEMEKLLSAGSWSSLKESKKENDGDFVMVKIPMTFEQHEAWLHFKSLMGTENDAHALAKAVTVATEHFGES